MTADRFMSLVRVSPSGCWEWQGRKTTQGRLVFVTDHGRRVAPRLYACELSMGRGPHGHLVHKCGNKDCVRFAPGHWEESQASLAVEKPDTRRDELTPEEVADFRYRWDRGAKRLGLQKRFNLTDRGFERARDAIMRAA